jgi:hypothetical protein
MAKYILVKKVKGQKFEYQVIDTESKAIVSKRTSARDYVACTADGSFYFGRLDLIGKGDHGKRLSHTAAILANPEAAYKKQVAYFRRITANNGLPRTPPNNGLPATSKAQQRKRKD